MTFTYGYGADLKQNSYDLTGYEKAIMDTLPSFSKMTT